MGYSPKAVEEQLLGKAKLINGVRHVKIKTDRPDLVWLRFITPITLTACLVMAIMAGSTASFISWTVAFLLMGLLTAAAYSSTKPRWIVDEAHASSKEWLSRNRLMDSLESYLEDAGLDTLSASVAASSAIDNIEQALNITGQKTIGLDNSKELKKQLKQLSKTKIDIVQA